MSAPAYDKLVLITRPTRLGELVVRFNTRSQAKFYIEHAGGDFSDYEREDDAYRRALDRLSKDLELGLKLQAMDRALVPTTLFCESDLVVAVGQDGLVANCAKYVGGSPIIAVNPDPSRFDGVLLPFQVESARAAAAAAIEGKAALRKVTLAQVKLNDGQSLLAFNDFFLGARTHVSARYRLEAGGRSERQSSSGIIVSTGAGSSGWLSSVFNMAAGVTRFTGGKEGQGLRWDWAERKLAFMVREPFASRHSGTEIAAGIVSDKQELLVESLMPMGGVIFSDGVESDYLDFNAGAIARVSVAERQARLVMPR